MQISFDSVSLTSDPYAMTKLKHESSSPRDTYLYQLARERGGIVVDSNYRSKNLVIGGRITGNDPADLEAKIDAFKELMSREKKNLDIDYAGGTRRYAGCYATNVDIDREYFHLNYVPFQVEFIAPSGVGEDTNATVDTTTGCTTAVKTGTEVVAGSAYPTPAIKITFASVTGVTTTSFSLNGDKITYSGAIAASDVLIFDTENKKVTKNGAEVDFVGMFPSFAVGNNNWQVDTNGTARNYAIEFSYKKKYL